MANPKETTPPEPKPVVCRDRSEDEKDGIIVHNCWEREGDCPEDGDASLSFTLPLRRWIEVVGRAEVKRDQFLLITWCRNTGLTCCSGYRRASLKVLDEEPDLDDKEKYPDEKWGDAFEYEVKSHEALQSEIL